MVGLDILNGVILCVFPSALAHDAQVLPPPLMLADVFIFGGFIFILHCKKWNPQITMLAFNKEWGLCAFYLKKELEGEVSQTS